MEREVLEASQLYQYINGILGDDPQGQSFNYIDT